MKIIYRLALEFKVDRRVPVKFLGISLTVVTGQGFFLSLAIQAATHLSDSLNVCELSNNYQMAMNSNPNAARDLVSDFRP